eukprot:633053_1
MSSQHRSVAPEEIGLIQRKIHSVRDGTDNDYMRSVDAVQSDFTSAVTDLESVHHYDVKQIQSRFDRKGKTVEEMYQAEKEKTEEKIEQLLRYLEESNLPIMPSSSCSDDLNGGSNSSMHITRAANGSLTRLLVPPWDMDAGHLKAESARPLTVVRAGTGFCSDGSKATGNERITRSKAKRNGNSQGFHVTLPESDIRDDLSRIGIVLVELVRCRSDREHLPERPRMERGLKLSILMMNIDPERFHVFLLTSLLQIGEVPREAARLAIKRSNWATMLHVC